jgi:hypothetical protein
MRTVHENSILNIYARSLPGTIFINIQILILFNMVHTAAVPISVRADSTEIHLDIDSMHMPIMTRLLPPRQLLSIDT